MNEQRPGRPPEPPKPVAEMSAKETADNIRRLVMRPKPADTGPSVPVHYVWPAGVCGQLQDERFQEWLGRQQYGAEHYGKLGWSARILLEYANLLDPPS